MSEMSGKKKPTVLLVSRRLWMKEKWSRWSRKLNWVWSDATMPQRMLNLDKFSLVVNLCCVIIGAHENRLTNKVILMNGTMYVHVASFELDCPSSFFFDWLSRYYDLSKIVVWRKEGDSKLKHKTHIEYAKLLFSFHES